MFVCSRSFYLPLNEKVFLFQCKCCIETRFSRCSSQEFAGFTVLICLQFSLNTVCSHLTCKRVKPGVKLNFSHLICDFYQAKINRSFLICEKFPSLLYLLVFFPTFQDRVTAILCRDGRKCHRSELSQKPNLCL